MGLSRRNLPGRDTCKGKFTLDLHQLELELGVRTVRPYRISSNGLQVLLLLLRFQPCGCGLLHLRVP